jgi:hypothetical protein
MVQFAGILDQSKRSTGFAYSLVVQGHLAVLLLGRPCHVTFPSGLRIFS